MSMHLKMNNSQNNVSREVKIDTHAWPFITNTKSKKGQQIAFQGIRKEIISVTNYKKNQDDVLQNNC